MEKFYKDIKNLTEKFRELGYTDEQILQLLGLYINKKCDGEY